MLCSGWVDDSPWLCIADESCLAPQLPWQPGRAARRKKKNIEAKGRGFHRETAEKGLDVKDKKGGIRTSDKEMQREQQR